MEELNNENYYSQEQKKEYMSYSQFKEFLTCENQALARVNGLVEDKKTDALLFGSYVDAYFSNEMEEFEKEHPEAFNSKTGELKATLKNTESVIKAIEEDEMLFKYLQGEHQKIMLGEIAGIPFKIKIDSYFPNKVIVDQKIIKDMNPIWDEDKHRKVSFATYWGYQYQAAIYQEIVRQNTGEVLPFVLAVTTKEDVPAKALLKFEQEDLDLALQEVIDLAPRFDQIKKGLIEPCKCGKCNWCRSTMKVTGIRSIRELDPNYEDNSSDY